MMDRRRTLNCIPTPESSTTSDDPPKLINGSGRPVGGSMAVITAMFKRAFVATHSVMPETSSAPKASGDCREIWKPRTTNAR